MKREIYYILKIRPTNVASLLNYAITCKLQHEDKVIYACNLIDIPIYLGQEYTLKRSFKRHLKICICRI